MSVSYGAGRLGNQIFRNMASSILAKKFDLYITYQNKEIIESIGFILFVGKNMYNEALQINDTNYFDIFNYNELYKNIHTEQHSYFQSKENSIFLYNYIQNELKTNIINSNNFRERYNNNNDCFVHIRLDDATQWNPGLNYYLNTLKQITFENLYISTDSRNHEIIKKIVDEYPNAQVIEYNEVNTIHFGSTCKYVILSHGSFSAIIGYLSFFSSVYYPEYENGKIWHGDMFSIDGWNKMKL